MKFSTKLAIGISLVTLLVFAGLIPLGRWHDEYLTLHYYHASGSQFLKERLLHWSPRPLSEILVYIYALAVYQADSPLIIVFLIPFWLALVAALLGPVLRIGGAFACASVLLALLVLGHPIAEVFYWPFGAVAYLPTVAAATLLLTLDWSGQIEKSSGQLWMFIALTAAATSSEVGALFTAIYLLLLIASHRLNGNKRSILFVIPLLVSLAVLYMQFIGRVAAGNEVFGDPLVAHHSVATIFAVTKHVFFELLKGDSGNHSFTVLISGIVTKALFFGGVYLTMSARQDQSDQRTQRKRLILIAASLITAVLTMAAALYNFGSVCCERHATMRQEYVFIAIGSLATYLAVRWPTRNYRHAGTLLLCSMLIPLTADIPKLKTEYLNYSQTRLASEETWQSGHSAGPAMQITQTKPGPIIGGLYIEPGVYQRGSKVNNDVPWMLIFLASSQQS